MNGCTKIVMLHLASHAQTEHIVRGGGWGGMAISMKEKEVR